MLFSPFTQVLCQILEQPVMLAAESRNWNLQRNKSSGSAGTTVSIPRVSTEIHIIHKPSPSPRCRPFLFFRPQQRAGEKIFEQRNFNPDFRFCHVVCDTRCPVLCDKQWGPLWSSVHRRKGGEDLQRSCTLTSAMVKNSTCQCELITIELSSNFDCTESSFFLVYDSAQ